MSGSLTIKAFLKGAGVNEEIRRFAVDQSVCTNFSYVTSKITQVFPDLTRKQFQLFWKDSDGDLILFSTDEELTDALGFVTDGVFRIFINVKNEEVNPEGGIRHKGVLCDGCEKEINGPRFKCIVCPDYDLCSLCERKSMHQDHDMLRICRPRERPTFMGFPFGGMAQGPPPPPPPPHHPGHHHHHPGGHPPPPPPPPHAEGAEGQFGPPPFFGAQFGPGMWPWKRWRKRCWRRWMSQQAGGEGAGWGQHSRDPSEDGSRHGDEPRCKDSNKGGDACGEKQPGNNDGPGCSQQQRCGDQGQTYLQNIGTTVAAMLDPLGIDVHVDIENNNQRTHISGRQRGQEQEKEQEDDVEMRPDSEQAAAAPAAASGCEGPGTPRMEDLTIRSPPQRDQTEAGEWTMLSRENAANECSDDARVVFPTLPSSRIAEALEQMKAMGYSDDGGWLTSLLETKGGDINKVLDSLQPKPQ